MREEGRPVRGLALALARPPSHSRPSIIRVRPCACAEKRILAAVGPALKAVDGVRVGNWETALDDHGHVRAIAEEG